MKKILKKLHEEQIRQDMQKCLDSIQGKKINIYDKIEKYLLFILSYIFIAHKIMEVPWHITLITYIVIFLLFPYMLITLISILF